ncbi:MAG TPA: DMT family transporter [Clostridia bacterium]|nr:DMT family transporter [Clostridia bacterium]
MTKGLIERSPRLLSNSNRPSNKKAFSLSHCLRQIVNTGIGCYFYFSSIQNLSAQSVAICGYLEPLSALIFSAIFLQERLTSLQIIGAILILGGAVFGEWFQSNKTISVQGENDVHNL